MKDYAFGVDVGGTNTKIGLVDLFTMSVVTSTTIKTVNGDNQDALKRIIDVVRRIQYKEDITDDRIHGIGFGILGPVVDGAYVLSVKGFHWQDHFNLKSEVEKILRWEVHIENDVNVIALGEYSLRRHDVQDLVTVAIGTDIGVGLILGGKVYSGKEGTAGEIAHIQLDPSQRTCHECKMSGCVSVLCGGNNVIRTFNMASKDLQIDSVKELYDLAAAGHEMATDHRNRFQGHLAKAIRLLHSLLDPQVIVIAGGVSKAGDPLLKGIEDHLGPRGNEFVKAPKVELSLLGDDAGILGAALLGRK